MQISDNNHISPNEEEKITQTSDERSQNSEIDILADSETLRLDDMIEQQSRYTDNNEEDGDSKSVQDMDHILRRPKR